MSMRMEVQLVERFSLKIAPSRMRWHALLRKLNILRLGQGETWLLSNRGLSRIAHPEKLGIAGLLRHVRLHVRPLHHVVLVWIVVVVVARGSGVWEREGVWRSGGVNLGVLVIQPIAIVGMAVGIDGQCACRRRPVVGKGVVRDMRWEAWVARKGAVGQVGVILVVWMLVRHSGVLLHVGIERGQHKQG
jgi:hypothetical protein